MANLSDLTKATITNPGLSKKTDTFVVGSVLQSVLDLIDFQTEMGSVDWVLMDGSDITGSALASYIGNTLPDATGRFLRGSGGSAAAMRIGQAEEIKSHTHSAVVMDTHDAGASTGRFQYNDTATGEPLSNKSVAATGGAETRPINVTVNTFVKIN